MEKDKLMASAESDIKAIQRLIDIIAILRAPGGCPWDREQTHESLKRPMIEEACEVIDAIDRNDTDNLIEELGDVLLQVVFHAGLGKDAGTFTMADIANRECEKMIFRHPHVFANPDDNLSSAEVLSKWEDIKEREKKAKGDFESNAPVSDSIDKIPKVLPALLKADKIQSKAARVGFDWDNVNGAFDKVAEESIEIKEAIAKGDKDEIISEIGDLLFAVVNVARFLGVDPESALNRTNEKFARRFRFVEESAFANNKDLKEMSLDEMDALWNEAKKQGK